MHPPKYHLDLPLEGPVEDALETNAGVWISLHTSFHLWYLLG